MKSSVVVVGSFVQDLAFYTKNFPRPGETVVGDFRPGPGGKGFNQAVAAARAGIPAQFIGAVGPDGAAARVRLFARDAGLHVHLVESMTKRCRFLTQVVEELALPATVHNTRAENLTLSVDIVTARACAPLHRLFGYARSYLAMGAQGLFLKGQDVVADMTEAARYWEYEADVVPSQSDPGGRIVRVKRLGRARKV